MNVDLNKYETLTPLRKPTAPTDGVFKADCIKQDCVVRATQQIITKHTHTWMKLVSLYIVHVVAINTVNNII